MTTIFRCLSSVLLLTLVSCGPAGPAPSISSGARQEGRTEPQKTLTLAALNAMQAMGDWSNSGSGGALNFVEVHSNPLVTNDVNGGYEARVASRLPSFEDGTILVLPDGRMQTTWKLRPDVKWHDGVPFTAEDAVFTWQVYQHPDVPFDRESENLLMVSVEAPDSSTVVITYKSTYINWMALGVREFWLLPRHLLADAFQADKQAFVNLPYWTTDYVHLGPFRIVDYGLGENIVLQRVDDYFLGRPKVDTIIIRAIADENAMVANMLAGAIDIVSESALPLELFARLRGDWERSGAGTVVTRQGNWNYLNIQFHPEWGRPPELSRDPRIRAGLFMGIDRDAIRELTLPALPDTEGDSFMLKNDPRAAVVGQPFARYRYNPARALQEFADAGWRPDPSGRRGPEPRLLDRLGEPAQVSLRGGSGDSGELAAIAQVWRGLGLDVVEEIVPASLARDREYQVKFPGLNRTSRGTGPEVFPRFDSRVTPTAQNRWTGSNNGSYLNPALDRLIDRLYFSLDDREQGLLLKDMGEILAADLPALSLYMKVSMAAVGKGVRALVGDYTAAGPGFLSRNAHLWDRG